MILLPNLLERMILMKYKIFDIDPQLKQYETDLIQRMENYKNKKKELLAPDVFEGVEAPDRPSGHLPDPADSAALAADFGLLVRHAEEVYESILHPPLPEAGPAAAGEPMQAKKEGKESWFSEAERLIAKPRQPSSGRRRS